VSVEQITHYFDFVLHCDNSAYIQSLLVLQPIHPFSIFEHIGESGKRAQSNLYKLLIILSNLETNYHR